MSITNSTSSSLPISTMLPNWSSPIGTADDPSSKDNEFSVQNPLACIAETAVIMVSLLLVLRLALQDPERNTLPSLSRRFPFYHARTERSRNSRRHWHLHAAALLLIRANEESSGGGGGVLDRLMAESLLSGRVELGACSTAGEGMAVVEERGRGRIELTVLEISTSEPQLGIPRRSTSQLEAGLPVEPDSGALTATADSNLGSNVAAHGQDRLADLRKVLGNNVLAHKEKWVNLVTSFSVLGVAIKLAAATLPWTVRVPAAFFLAGWSFVQFLLYLFHLGELDESSAGNVLKAIRLHRQLAKNSAVQKGTMCLTALLMALPVIWIGYCAGFPNGRDVSTFNAPIPLSTNTTGGDVSPAFIYRTFPAFCLWVYGALFVGLILLLMVPAVLHFLLVAPYLVFRVERCGQRAQLLLAIPNLGISIGAIVGIIKAVQALVHLVGAWSLFNVLIGTGMLVLTSYTCLGLLTDTCRLRKKTEDETSGQDDIGPAAFTNKLLALYLFGELVYNYQSEGTYKPAWLEYLG